MSQAFRGPCPRLGRAARVRYFQKRFPHQSRRRPRSQNYDSPCRKAVIRHAMQYSGLMEYFASSLFTPLPFGPTSPLLIVPPPPPFAGARAG